MSWILVARRLTLLGRVRALPVFLWLCILLLYSSLCGIQSGQHGRTFTQCKEVIMLCKVKCCRCNCVFPRGKGVMWLNTTLVALLLCRILFWLDKIAGKDKSALNCHCRLWYCVFGSTVHVLICFVPKLDGNWKKNGFEKYNEILFQFTGRNFLMCFYFVVQVACCFCCSLYWHFAQ